MRIAVVEPDAARNDTAFQAQARMWEFIARKYGCSFTVFADRELGYRNERLRVRTLRRIGGRFWCPPYPALLAQLGGYDVILTGDPSLYPYAFWAAIAARASGSRLVLDTSVTLLTPPRETRRGRLILRVAKAVFDLAHRGGARPVKIAEIAARQHIPQKFLELILAQLKQGGFVQSRRGAEGGYLLARRPETLLVGEVLRFIEALAHEENPFAAGVRHIKP